ncbi:large ribosomal subunit protein uL29c-like [Phragmites australis]|uniref:large ribosomal subunit protein uL29c-like n=1 Tax=Phragmites australis TaxID=29695 RepID=UPI002D78CD94|nr:large ribosomal subunit protein uL29c-like [Phragmites australis]
MATMSLAAASPLASTPGGVAAPAPRTAFLGLRAGGAPATRFFPALAAAPQPAAGRGAAAAVVQMAKREQELEEIRDMSTERLEEEVVDLKGELFLLRLKRSARQEFKNSEFGRMRKRIARMLTVKREREIEQGINKRLSRKLDRKWKQSIVVRPPPSLRENKEE